MSDKLGIQYRDFYDVPRIFVVNHRGKVYLFDCPFDQDLDEYPEIYKVFVLPSDSYSNLSGSWDELASRASAYLGEVPVKSVQFDPTRRREIDADVIDELERKLSANL
jgi:hypothetical protein